MLILLISRAAADPPSGGSLGSAPGIQVREWNLPRRDERPHDPAVGMDGSLWYTAQKGKHGWAARNRDRTDPRVPLPTRDSGPHGLAADRDGNIWYTANYAGRIGRLDVKTGVVTEFRLNDPRARDPHSLAFDPAGRLWFTVQGGNMIGKLDPASGKVEVREVPTGDAARAFVRARNHRYPS